MALLDPDTPPASARSRRSLAVGVAALGVLVVGAWLAWRVTRPARPVAALPSLAPRAKATPLPGGVDVTADVAGAVVSVDGRRLGPAPARGEGLAPGRHVVRVEAPGRPPYELEIHVVPGQVTRVAARLSAPASAPVAAAPAPAANELRVDSDVPGAQVFVDHQLRGRAPLVLRDVTPGSHRVNVTAEGYEMQAEDVVVDGPTSVHVSFKEVRLDESLAVVHKHGLSSCEGRLHATPRGLRYEPAKGGHAFDVPLAALQVFEVDYLKKELRVKAGGRAYNFTTRDGDADALLRFQQKVSGVARRPK
jgi:hypothetical protein